MLYAAMLPTKFCWATLKDALHVSEASIRSRQCNANTEVFDDDAIVFDQLNATMFVRSLPYTP